MLLGYKSALVKAFYLLVNADGAVNPKELASGLFLAQSEAIPEAEFTNLLEALKKRNRDVVSSECVEELKRQSTALQIRCIAWLCVIANSDGFMDKTEWQFIYRLYHQELKLQLDEIMKAQKELAALKQKNSLAPQTP